MLIAIQNSKNTFTDLSTEVFLFTSCGDHYSVLLQVSARKRSKINSQHESKIASFWVHGSESTNSLVSESTNLASIALWKHFKRLQFIGDISGLENAAHAYLCLFTNELKRCFEYASNIQAFECQSCK